MASEKLFKIGFKANGLSFGVRFISLPGGLGYRQHSTANN